MATRPQPNILEPNQLVVDKKRKNILLREPQKLGSYSVKKGPEGRFYDGSSSELRVLSLPKNQKNIRFDLRDGYVRLRDGGEILCANLKEEPGLKEMLQWILNNRHSFQLKSNVATDCLLNTDFVTYRGVLTRIMTAPYENQEGWLVCVSKFKGTIYMCLFMSDEKREKEMGRDDQANLMCHGGLRFEEYISVALDPSQATGKEADTMYHNEYNCVVRSRISNHSLVYGAEMDCLAVRPTDPETCQPKDFVEIKTTRTMSTRRHWDNLCRFKMVKWWAQCHLIGIPTLVCGYRDDDMVVRDIQSLSVHEMPKTCKAFWFPDVCLSFLDTFLLFVKKTVTEDDANVVYEFDWRPGSNVSVTKTTNRKRPVLTEWYCNSL